MSFPVYSPEDQARGRRIADLLGNPATSQQAATYGIESYLGPPKETPVDIGIDFIKSAFSAGTKEMIGFDPSPDVEEFRMRHPIAGFVSEMAGMAPAFAIPFSPAWMKGVQMLPKGARLFKAATTIENTFLKGAAMEGLRWAPWESARLAGSIAAMPLGAKPSNVLSEAAFEMPLFMGLGGAGRFIKARKGMPTPESAKYSEIPMAQDEMRVYRTIRGYDVNAHPQEKVARLTAALGTVEGEAEKEILERVKAFYEAVVVREEPGLLYAPGIPAEKRIRTGYGAYTTNPLSTAEATETASKRMAGRLNSLWEGKGGVESIKLAAVDGGIQDPQALNAVLAAWGEAAPAGWKGFTQYPRMLIPKIDPLSEEGAKTGFGRLLREDMRRMHSGVDRDVWFSREAGDNRPWIGITRVRTGDPTLGAHKWFIYKTHEPQKFAPGIDSLERANIYSYVRGLRHAFPGIPRNQEEAVNLLENIARANERRSPERKLKSAIDGLPYDPNNPQHVSEVLRRVVPPESIAPLLHKARRKIDAIHPGMRGARFMEPVGRTTEKGLADERQAWTRFFDSLLSEEAQIARQEMTQVAKDYGFMAKKLLAPVSVEFWRNPRAVGIWTAVRDTFDDSRAIGVVDLFGAPKIDPNTNFIRKIWDPTKGIERSPGLLDRVRPAYLESEESAKNMWKAWLTAYDYETMGRQAGFSKAVMDALRHLDAQDTKQLMELQATREALGLVDDFIPMKRHFLISRSYVGDFRVPIFQEGGKSVVGYGSGTHPQGAIQEAREIVKLVNETAAAKGAELRLQAIPDNVQAKLVSEVWSPKGKRALEDMTAMQQDLFLNMSKIHLGNPLVDEVMRARAELLMLDPTRFKHRTGQIGFLGWRKPLSWREARDKIISNVMETRNLIARDATWGLLRPEMIKLTSEDVNVAKQLTQRWNQLQGVQGPVNRGIEKAIDGWLAPVFGTRSATRAARALNEATYFLTLGAMDVGFVTINALTPIQTVLPELSFTLKTPPSTLAHYYAHCFNMGTDGAMSVASFVDPVRFMKQAWRLMAHPDEEFAPFIKRAIDHGVMGRQFVEQVVGGDSRMMREIFKGRIFTPDESAWRNVLNAMQTPVAMSEEFARGYAFTCGWLVGKDFFGMRGERLWTFAKKFAERTNYGYDSATRSRVITGAIGSGFGLFKNWTINYITNMGSYSAQALRGNWEPLVWGMLGTGSVAGAVGVPGYGIASAFTEAFSNKDLTEWTYEILGNKPGDHSKPWIADMALYGWPSVFGVSLQGRAAAPGASVFRDTEMLLNTAHLRRAQALGDLFSSGAQMAKRGMNPYDSSEFIRAMVGAFAPRTLQRWYASSAQDGLMSLHTGNRVMPSPQWFAKTGYVLGLTPLEIEKSLDAHNELWEDSNKMREKIQFYGKLLADAEMRGGRVPYHEVINRAMIEGVSLASLARSVKSHQQKIQEDQLQRQWDPYLAGRVRQARGLPMMGP